MSHKTCVRPGCPNPAVDGGKICISCSGVDLTSHIDIEPSGPIIVAKVTPRGGLESNPRDASLKASLVPVRKCVSVVDDGSEPCKYPALRDSEYCRHHDASRRDPSLEITADTMCKARTEEGRCGNQATYRAYCDEHYDRTILNSEATPNRLKPDDIDDLEAQIRGMQEDIANMRSIVKYGQNDRDRINATRAIERMVATANRLHKELVKKRRADMKQMEMEALGLGGIFESEDMKELPTLEEFRDSLPDGEII